MKKIISIAFAAILAGLAISCQKEELVSDKTDAVQYTFNITVNDQVGFDNDASTKGGEPPKYKNEWVDGDRIFLFFKPSNGSLLTDTYATLTYNESAWGGQVTGPTSLGVEGTLSAVYVYNLDDSVKPEFTDNKWTIPTGNVFYNCQPGVGYSVSGSEISASLNLEAPADFVRFTIYQASDEPLTCNTVKGWKDVVIGSEMTFSNATCTGYMTGFENSNSQYKDYYGRIVSGNSLNGKDCEFSVVKNGKVYEHTAKPNTDKRSFSMKITDWTASCKLSGVFTVGMGADGKAGTEDDIQVRFSQGNLYAEKQNDVWKWHFYDKQYKYNSIITTSGKRTALDSDIEIDLFTWGYSASSLLPTGNTCVEGHTTIGDLQLVYNKSSSDSEKKGDDWGVAYCESNGLAVGTWRTLSDAEWKYLVNFDSNENIRNGKCKCGVTVCGKSNCLVLLPDDWEWDETDSKFVHVGKTWQEGGYPAEDSSTAGQVTWETMEAAGAVCLPAAGIRTNGKSIMQCETAGVYWSSTVASSNLTNAVNMGINSSKISFAENSVRGNGNSVRLITNVK